MYVHYFFRSIFKCLISVKSQFGEKNLVLIDKFAPLVLRTNVTMSQPLPNFALLCVKWPQTGRQHQKKISQSQLPRENNNNNKNKNSPLAPRVSIWRSCVATVLLLYGNATVSLEKLFILIIWELNLLTPLLCCLLFASFSGRSNAISMSYRSGFFCVSSISRVPLPNSNKCNPCIEFNLLRLSPIGLDWLYRA